MVQMNETDRPTATVIALPASHTAAPATYSFSRSEIARLRIYRAAVIFGFYTDELQGRAVAFSPPVN
jgi:hypothetical protein